MGIDQEISNPEVTGGNAPRVWMTRGGHRGEYEEPSFLEGTTGGGWTTIPNLSGCVGLEDYRDRVASVHPDKTKAAIRNWATQLAQLRDDMRVNDIVVMPRKGKRTAAVGRITSEYLFDPAAGATHRHFRQVEWITLNHPKASFHEQVRRGLRAQMTICLLSDHVKDLAMPEIMQLGNHAQVSGDFSSVITIKAPLAGRVNYQLGVEHGLWGWRERLWVGGVIQQRIQALRVGQPILLVLGGPGRVPAGSYSPGGKPYKTVAAGFVVRSHYESDSIIWPDHLYPHRVGIRFEAVAHDVPLSILGPGNWEGVRDSASVSAPTKGANLEQTSDFLELVLLLQDLGGRPRVPTWTDPGAGVPDLIPPNFDPDAELDRYIMGKARVESFRPHLFGNKTKDICALCHRDLPVRLLISAHIKPRSKCTNHEKVDVNVVMANCLLGCDALYERGVVTVNSDGMIKRGQRPPYSGLSEADMNALVSEAGIKLGSKCSAFRSENAAYFAWHAEHRGAEDA